MADTNTQAVIQPNQPKPPYRPTKYTKEKLELAELYYQKCKSKGEMPYIEDVALELDVDEDTIGNWAKKHKPFFGTVKKIKMLQKRQLENGGLANKVNVSMSIFLLKAVHGLKETTIHEVDQKTPTKVESTIILSNGKSTKTDIKADTKTIDSVATAPGPDNN